ncbi:MULTISPECIES: VanZ family protein [Streptomyces]|uniref:VanZ family protein n=1 Tax=Streptomyces TaxID=1883 RepID=UPI000B9E4646|nr:VanZ family protein [Streptomyces kasugaensis]
MWQVVLIISPPAVALFLTAALALALTLALWSALAPDRGAPRITARLLLAGWLLLLLVATLTPTQPIGSGDATVWWLPGRELFDPGAQLLPGELSMLVREQIANTALYLPLPLLLRFAAPHWSAAAAFLLGVGLCTAIEATQLLMRAGRIADTGDILCAAAGTILGATLAAVAQQAVAFITRRRVGGRAVRVGP